ncbi:radical SAM protein [Trueperella abortisuis]|uniref:radical SAM protein n=1 Tax=Trueperella abortisuis TaxID=445930 RepID=UPI0035D9A33C
MDRIIDLEPGKVALDLLTGKLFVRDSDNRWGVGANESWETRHSALTGCSAYSESGDGERLVFTIETTRDCNFACLYCYQNDRKTRDRISFHTIDLALDYIASAILASGKPSPLIRLIGGEPLLAKKEILYLMDGLRAREIAAEFHTDTNGRVPIQWFLDEGFPCEFFICLSLPADHNRVRYSSGHDSATAIYNNISALRLKDGQSVFLSYNVHDQNLNDFSRFLDWIAPLRNNPVERVTVTNIDNYSFNLHAFRNRLSAVDFSEWLVGTAIPALIDHGWSVPFRRVVGPTLCQGHQPYSCKIYAGGQVTICDAMQIEDSRLTIEELSHDVGRMNATYSEMKSTDPWKNPGCQNCYARIVCFGRKWCERYSCTPRKFNDLLASNGTVIRARLKEAQ